MLGEVPDRRGRQGRQYELRSVLGPGGDAGGGERPQGDLALGSPAAAGSAAAVWNRERALSLPRHLSLLLPGSSTRRPWWRRSGASTEIIYLITSLPPETA